MALAHSCAGRLGRAWPAVKAGAGCRCWQLLISRFRLWHRPGPRRAKETEGAEQSRAAGWFVQPLNPSQAGTEQSFAAGIFLGVACAAPAGAAALLGCLRSLPAVRAAPALPLHLSLPTRGQVGQDWCSEKVSAPGEQQGLSLRPTQAGQPGHRAWQGMLTTSQCPAGCWGSLAEHRESSSGLLEQERKGVPVSSPGLHGSSCLG